MPLGAVKHGTYGFFRNRTKHSESAAVLTIKLYTNRYRTVRDNAVLLLSIEEKRTEGEKKIKDGVER